MDSAPVDSCDHRPYVVSEDIFLLLTDWAKRKGFTLPEIDFFRQLRQEMKAKLETIFPHVIFHSEEEIQEGIFILLEHGPRFPVITVSLDRIYCPFPFAPLHLDTTRLVNPYLEDIGSGSRNNSLSLDQQIQKIADLGVKEIQLVDDVVFTGRVLIDIVKKFNDVGIKVERITAGITITTGHREIVREFPRIHFRSVKYYQSVIDEVCERDFYAGIPQGGRLIGRNGLALDGQAMIGLGVKFDAELCAPYFAPFGGAKYHRWASIPPKHGLDWSVFCLDQSIKLWRAIEQKSDRVVRMKDLDRIPFGLHHRTFPTSSFVKELELCRFELLHPNPD